MAKATGKAPSKPKAAAKPRTKKVVAAAGSVGLAATACADAPAPAELRPLANRVAEVGGAVLATYREPLGGHWLMLAALPVGAIKPTPYQRELSKTHADKLAGVIPKVGRFLDPIIAVDSADGFVTPNGMHRLSAMTTLGAQAVVVLLVPEPEIAFRILALNTEKAHTLRDKALEVVRMARALVGSPTTAARLESDLALEFEHPSLLTLGVCYERNGRFSGGAYNPVVSRCEVFAERPLRDTLPEREQRATALLELDEAVAEAVTRLKDAGFSTGYLKPIVVARINPLRFAKPGATSERPDFAKTIAKMLEGARAFDASKVRAQDVALAASMGGGDE